MIDLQCEKEKQKVFVFLTSNAKRRGVIRLTSMSVCLCVCLRHCSSSTDGPIDDQFDDRNLPSASELVGSIPTTGICVKRKKKSMRFLHLKSSFWLISFQQYKSSFPKSCKAFLASDYSIKCYTYDNSIQFNLFIRPV